jgi:hypothetical protein
MSYQADAAREDIMDVLEYMKPAEIIRLRDWLIKHKEDDTLPLEAIGVTSDGKQN